MADTKAPRTSVPRNRVKAAPAPASVPPSAAASRQVLSPQRTIGNQAVLRAKALSTSGGESLSSAARALMESRFGEDFRHVRVHTDPPSAGAARALGAAAFTTGPHIHFGLGRYQPASREGQRLLAHELTHVVQQRRGGTATSPSADIARHAEREADRMADHVTTRAGDTTAVPTALPHTRVTAAPHGAVQCQFLTSPFGAGGGLAGEMERDRRVTMGTREPLQEREPNVVDALYLGSAAITRLSDAALREASVAQRVRMIELLAGTFWTAWSEESTILRILDTTPVEDAEALLAALSVRDAAGTSLLDQLENAVDLGNNLLLYDAVSRLRLRAMAPANALPSLAEAPILPWHNVMGFFETKAQFVVSRTARGKIRVKYPAALILAPNEFSHEFATLPEDTFKSPGHDFEPDEFVWVHDYDRERLVPIVARDLIGYKHQLGRNILAHWAEIGALALPLGPAKSVAGRAAVIIVEKILPITSILVSENRRNIVRWFPEWGPTILFVNDLIQAGVALYGIVRFAISGAAIIKSWRDVKAARALAAAGAVEDVDPDVARLMRQIEQHLDDVTAKLDEIRVAEQAERAGAGATVKPPSEPSGGQLLSMEGRARTGTVPGLEKVPPGSRLETQIGPPAKAPKPPPSSEPNVQALPVPLEEVEAGQARLAAGAELSTPRASSTEVATLGSGRRTTLQPVESPQPTRTPGPEPPSTSASSPSATRRGSPAVGVPLRAGADEVPAVALRRQLRETLEARLRWLTSEADQLAAAKREIDAEIALLSKQIDEARRQGRAGDLRTLRAQRDELIGQRVVGSPFADRILEVKRLLAGTERDYYEALTAASRSRRSYVSIAQGPRDARFAATQGASSVDHVYPRSRIFLIEGFEALSWEEQTALFALRKNLKLVPEGLNSFRGNRPYASLTPTEWAIFTKDPSLIRELIALEDEMGREIAKMVANPRSIPAPQ